jgi:hypothetical protein
MKSYGIKQNKTIETPVKGGEMALDWTHPKETKQNY